MSSMVNAIMSFFSYSVLAIGAQNVIFTRGLGLSSGLRMINDPKKDTMYFCAFLTLFQMINSLLVYFLRPLIGFTPFARYTRFVTPVLIVVCCTVSYILVVFVLSIAVQKSTFKRMIYSITSASINSAIVGTIIFTTTLGLTLAETIGFAFGSSVGYMLAMLLILEGDRKLRPDLVPATFRGLPITLIYISVLALAVYALTGHRVAL